MFRRIVILLLYMVLPLQALASVHMTVSAMHRLQMVQMTEMHDGKAHDQHHAGHHEHAKSGHKLVHVCTNCDLCMPPLASIPTWVASENVAVAVAAPEPVSSEVIPPSFEHPPRPIALI